MISVLVFLQDEIINLLPQFSFWSNSYFEILCHCFMKKIFFVL